MMRPFLYLVLLAAAVALAPGGSAAPLLAQATATPGGARDSDADSVAGASPDSSDVRGRAREAQRRFEYLRRRHMPLTWGWGGGSCDDNVGRMCWRHDTGSLWWPEPEDPEVGRARDALLLELDTLAQALPGDPWVMGQRVHYLLEAGRVEEAEAVARRCAVEDEWWCGALLGLTLHVQGRYVESEARFRDALAAMEPARARRWNDLDDLLDRDGRRLLAEAGKGGASGEGALRNRLWRLADPLYLVEGNDRLTEHFARRAVVAVREGAENPHGISWGDDLAELLVRYGWEVGWERIPRRPTDLPGRESVVGHEHPESRSFMPPGRVLRDPAAAGPQEWDPGLAYAPSAYAPRAAPLVLPMESRLSVFPRGDRLLLVAPFRLPPDTTRSTRDGERPPFHPISRFADVPVQAGLFVVPEVGDTVHAHRLSGDSSGVLSLDVPAGRHWVSVEVWSPATGRAGRVRHGLDAPPLPRDVAALSDLLLLSPGPEPTSLEEALPRVLTGSVVESGQPLVVLWEVTGLGFRDEALRYTLRVVEPEGNLLRRAGRWLGVLDRSRPQGLEWTEAAPEDPVPALRSVSMRLPELEPGRYTLRLELSTRGRTTLVAERVIRVVPRGS